MQKSTILYERIISLDSCVAIELLTNYSVARKVLSLLHGKHTRIALQDVVLNEVQRITKVTKEDIIRKISLIFHKELYLFSTTDHMRQLAVEIEKKYSVCHFPDSIILAACKIQSFTLFSFDRGMLQSADFDGVIAFNPSKIRRI